MPHWNTAQVAEAYCRQGLQMPQAIAAACGDGEPTNKFGVAPKENRTVNGITFASAREAEHYQCLKLAQQRGWIADLELQPRFLLQPRLKLPSGKTQRSIVYVADFRFVRNGKIVVVDVKGMETPVFRMKRKMFNLKYPNIALEIWK
jgi:hypothetical protein